MSAEARALHWRGQEMVTVGVQTGQLDGDDDGPPALKDTLEKLCWKVLRKILAALPGLLAGLAWFVQ